jgi:hypothetical protein
VESFDDKEGFSQQEKVNIEIVATTGSCQLLLLPGIFGGSGKQVQK